MTTDTLSFQGTPIQVDLHPAQGAAKAALLYFHGGGLLYGSRQDLPADYVHAVTAAGYHLLCFDYLLAPESPLGDIHRSVDAAVDWYLTHRQELLGGPCPYVLFGRSAGGYLILTLAHRLLARRSVEPPAALWCFYGYHTLLHPYFIRPCPAYQRLPMISAAQLPDLTGDPPRSQAPLEERYFLYVSARQRGAWPSVLTRGDAAALTTYAVPDQALSQLPPAFLTASTGDQDVPPTFSSALSQAIPRSRLYTVYGLDHDYDRDPHLPESQSLYAQAIAWLDGQLG